MVLCVQVVCLSVNNREIATGSADHGIRIYDMYILINTGFYYIQKYWNI